MVSNLFGHLVWGVLHIDVILRILNIVNSVKVIVKFSIHSSSDSFVYLNYDFNWLISFLTFNIPWNELEEYYKEKIRFYLNGWYFLKFFVHLEYTLNHAISYALYSILFTNHWKNLRHICSYLDPNSGFF